MQWVVAGSLSGCRSKSQNAPRTFDNFLELFQYFWLFFGGTEGGTTAPYCHCFPFQNCGWLVQRRCCSFAQRMERCGTKQEVIFRFLSVRASLKIDMLPTNASGCGTRKHWKSSKNYVVCLPATSAGPLTSQLHGKTLRALPLRSCVKCITCTNAPLKFQDVDWQQWTKVWKSQVKQQALNQVLESYRKHRKPLNLINWPTTLIIYNLLSAVLLLWLLLIISSSSLRLTFSSLSWFPPGPSYSRHPRFIEDGIVTVAARPYRKMSGRLTALTLLES